MKPLTFGAPRELSESEVSELLRHAIVDFVSAAGRNGALDDGRRFSEIYPGLVYIVLRHAPVHGWLYAAALTAAAETRMRTLEPVSRIVVGVMHSIVSGAMTSAARLAALNVRRYLLGEQVAGIIRRSDYLA